MGTNPSTRSGTGFALSMAISESPLAAIEGPHLTGLAVRLPPRRGAGLGFSHAERSAVGGDHGGVVQEPVEHRVGPVCSGRNWPQFSNGWWQPRPSDRRS